MIFRELILVAFIPLFLIPCVYAEEALESDQQINEFSLAGYGKAGKKTWEIFGKTADIFNQMVQLDDVVGNLYGEDEEVKLTAETGNFDKESGKVKLIDNVIITTSSGAKLTTDSLEWDRKESMVSTEDDVSIVRDNIMAVAAGAKGEPNLNKVSLEKDVRLFINPVEPGNEEERIVISCDGPLEIDYEKNIATFYNNVKVEREDVLIYSDKMDIFLAAAGNPEDKEKGLMGSKIEQIIARGNVKIVRGQNISYCEEATYSAKDSKIILTGRPKLIISSTEEFKDASFGN